MSLAPEGQALWEEHEADGLVVIGAMQDGRPGHPSVDDLNDWAFSFNLQHPVLADVDGEIDDYAVAGGGYPTYVIIDREMVIVNSNLWPFDAQAVVAEL